MYCFSRMKKILEEMRQKGSCAEILVKFQGCSTLFFLRRASLYKCICSYSHVLRDMYDIHHPEGRIFLLGVFFPSEKEKKA